jgi:hypothetical protein
LTNHYNTYTIFTLPKYAIEQKMLTQIVLADHWFDFIFSKTKKAKRAKPRLAFLKTNDIMDTMRNRYKKRYIL